MKAIKICNKVYIIQNSIFKQTKRDESHKFIAPLLTNSTSKVKTYSNPSFNPQIFLLK